MTKLVNETNSHTSIHLWGHMTKFNRKYLICFFFHSNLNILYPRIWSFSCLMDFIKKVCCILTPLNYYCHQGFHEHPNLMVCWMRLSHENERTQSNPHSGKMRASMKETPKQGSSVTGLFYKVLCTCGKTRLGVDLKHTWRNIGMLVSKSSWTNQP